MVPEFAPRQVARIEPTITDAVAEHVEQMLRGPREVDLLTSFAGPVTLTVLFSLLGVPYRDHAFLRHAALTMQSASTTETESAWTKRRVLQYLETLVRDKNGDPGDDVASRLVHDGVTSGRTTVDETVMTLLLLLFAGFETTEQMIALGTVLLLTRSDQRAPMIDGDVETGAAAVEEMLRYLTVSHFGRRRVATQDAELAGTLVRAGEGVIVATNVGNRDAAAFPDPDRLDLERDARGHLAFGFGPHLCLGAQLARTQIRVALQGLLTRFPDLRLSAPADQLRYRHDKMIYGLFALPVTR